MTIIADPEEILLRQVHPQFYVDGKLGSRAFKPNSGDAGFMSADRECVHSAEEAFLHYTQQMKKHSACVCALTVEEFVGENISCKEDPLLAVHGVEANPAHALLDYNKHEEKAWKNIAQRLKGLAEKRGIRFKPV